MLSAFSLRASCSRPGGGSAHRGKHGISGARLQLFGRKFFESNDETVVVPDPQPYTLELTISGEDKDLAKAIRNASSLARDEKKPPPGTAGLIARARGDYGRILAALYANGYYGGTITISIDGESAETLRPDIDLPDPVTVTPPSIPARSSISARSACSGCPTIR